MKEGICTKCKGKGVIELGEPGYYRLCECREQKSEVNLKVISAKLINDGENND